MEARKPSEKPLATYQVVRRVVMEQVISVYNVKNKAEVIHRLRDDNYTPDADFQETNVHSLEFVRSFSPKSWEIVRVEDD